MRVSARRPGTFTVESPIDPITPGTTVRITLDDLQAGPKNKRGYLKKYLPFGLVVFDSYTSSVRVEGRVNNREFHPVPENSARTFDSVPVTQVSIRNPSGSGADVAASDIPVILSLPEEQIPQIRAGPSQLLSDLIPGVSFGVRTER